MKYVDKTKFPETPGEWTDPSRSKSIYSISELKLLICSLEDFERYSALQ